MSDASIVPASRRFLTADWRALLMVNYAVDSALLQPFVPAGVQLDLWEGQALVSMVGFLFLRTRVLGIPFPFHQNFEEVNLRFYVKRKTPEGWRRGVVFVKEIVPKPVIAAVARGIYNEQYYAMRMRHTVALDSVCGGTVRYEWYHGNRWHSLCGAASGCPSSLSPGSAEEFIFEHYWGYTRQPDGSTMEYEVRHDPWRAWNAEQVSLDCDVEAVYGVQWVEPLHAPPVSAFIAEGSAVEVRQGKRLSIDRPR